MITNNDVDVQITSKPSQSEEVYFEISSADAPIGSGLGFVKTSGTFYEETLTDELEFSIVAGGENPYKWFLRPDDTNQPPVNWTTKVTIKKSGKTGKAQKVYARSAPILPDIAISIVNCVEKLMIKTNAVYSEAQKLVLDTESTDRHLVLRVVNDGTGTYPYEYKLVQDGVIHHLSVSIINELGHNKTEEISYMRDAQKPN